MPKHKVKTFNNSQKIAILGLGLDNRALLELLSSYKIKSPITIFDDRSKKDLPTLKLPNLKIDYRLGQAAHNNLKGFDIIFRSPGWPLNSPELRAVRRNGQTKITSPLNLFFELCPSKNIIGVTGTKGKGTTATLIYKILKDSGRHVWLAGNIGVAPLSFLKKIRPTDYVVLELSSFQLEDLEYSPRLAVITNLFSEHLAPADPHNPNFHTSLSTYWQAKLRIAVGKDNQYLIANKNLKNKISRTKLTSRIIYFSPSALPSKLTGNYNRDNIGAAVAIAKILKIPANKYKKTIAAFGNLEHRLEFVAEKKGVKYFDNSFSTTPESTVLDLQSFRTPLIQIAGGADKGANFRPLALAIKKKVKHLIILPGRGTARLQKELKKIKFPPARLSEVKSMAEAVKIAQQQASTGDVVLLSTACASFGLFKNYKERGDLFKKYVRSGK